MSFEIDVVGYDIDVYKMLFIILFDEHNSYCNTWRSKSKLKVNLNKTYICDIYNLKGGIQSEFKIYLDSFLEDLEGLYIDIMERIESECEMPIRGRTKAVDSIIFKLNEKRKQDGGKFPVNKCLNDLLGFRIVDNNYKDNIEAIKDHLNILNEKGYRIRHINRNSSEYKAYHVYFKGDNNYFFPIELQIWDAENEQMNLDSHERYKQKYIEWVKNYKDL